MNNLERKDKIGHQDVPIGLPKQVKSLCPECKKVIDAEIYEEDGKIWMKKTCDEHGDIKDLIYGDAKLYKKAEKWGFPDPEGIKKPNVEFHDNCPNDCGLCSNHLSYACLSNVDLTNRCNLRCPICFANSNVAGYVYEPSYEQVVEILKNLYNTNKPGVDLQAIQFTGGEPTIHPRFVDIIKAAKDIGFAHIQVATNGILIGNSLEFAKKCKEAGLYTLYLQFDGLTDEVYKKTCGAPLLKVKKQAIENARKVGIRVVFVPTVVRGVNNDQVGDLFNFAMENSDVVTGVSYQPISFTGRYSEKERINQRYTLSDLAHDLEKQTNGIVKAYRDFYPLSITTPLSDFFKFFRKEKPINITCHTNCGLGTYVIVNFNEKPLKPVPLTEFIDVEGLTMDLYELNKKGGFKTFTQLKALNAMRKHFKKDKAPEGLTLVKFLKIFEGIGKGHVQEWKMVIIAGMHFQDCYNYNLDRIKRCVIHYGAPNGRIYPFCTINSGPFFRESIEKEFSIPLEEWKKKHGEDKLYKGD